MNSNLKLLQTTEFTQNTYPTLESKKLANSKYVIISRLTYAQTLHRRHKGSHVCSLKTRNNTNYPQCPSLSQVLFVYLRGDSVDRLDKNVW